MRMRVPVCPRHCERTTDTPFFYPLPLDYGTNILADNEGRATNRYEDGTIGVTADEQAAADEQDAIFCISCLSECNWVDV